MNNQVLIKGFIAKWNNVGYYFQVKTQPERFSNISYSLEIKGSNWVNNLHYPYLLQELDKIIKMY